MLTCQKSSFPQPFVTLEPMQTIMELEFLHDDLARWVAFSDSHRIEIGGMTENGERVNRT